MLNTLNAFKNSKDENNDFLLMLQDTLVMEFRYWEKNVAHPVSLLVLAKTIVRKICQQSMLPRS